MKTCPLSKNNNHRSLLSALSSNGISSDDSDTVLFMLPRNSFLGASAIALLTAWGLAVRETGAELRFHGSSDNLDYLSRMDVFRHLAYDYDEHFNRHDEAGRFLPVSLVSDSESVKAAAEAISELVLRRFDNAREFLPALDWCVYEVIDNVRLHSAASTPGVVCAQYYPKKRRLDVAIVDYGQGIKSSLEERFELWSHGDAISKALERGATRDPSVGQGNGLAGTLEIVKRNGGSMEVWSGDIDFRVKSGEDAGFIEIPTTRGTGVFLSLDTTRPVSLDETFIGDPGWSYLVAQAEEWAEEGGLRVIEQCLHTGGRETARPLRRKIENLLPEMDVPLVLDFGGVDTVSSSFLDELLGRLVASLGQDEFHQKVRIINMSDEHRRMGDVVIQQRLAEGQNGDFGMGL